MSQSCGTGGWSGPLPGDPDNNVTLSATTAFGGINITLGYPATNSHAVAFVLLYRSTSNVLSSAIELGKIAGSMYHDKITVTEPTVFYYWVQVVSINGTVNEPYGPVSATALVFSDQMVDELSGKVPFSALNPMLQSEILNITTLQSNLIQETNDRIAAHDGLSAALADVDAGLASAMSYIDTETTQRVEGQNALTQRLDVVAAANDDAVAAILTEQTTRASEDASLASQITTLATRLNDTGDSLTMEQRFVATASSIEGLQGQYAVKIVSGTEADPVVAGFALAVDDPVEGPTTSAFTILADAFALYTAGGKLRPFSIVDDSVVINGQLRVGNQTLSEIEATTGTMLTEVGEFATEPPVADYQVNSVYKNTSDNNTYILREAGGVKVWAVWLTAGAPGNRGTVQVVVNGYSAWPAQNVATDAFKSTGHGDPLPSDQLTLTNGTGWAQTRVWDGDSWETMVAWFDGNVLIDGTVIPSKIDTRGLSIRDAGGNIILAAGSTLNPAYAAAGTRNSEAIFSPKLVWEFLNTLDSWTAARATLTANANSMTVTPSSTDPYIISPPNLNFDGSVYDKVRARVKRTNGTGWQGTLYYTTDGHGYSGTYSKTLSDTTVLGQYVIMEWDMASVADWTASSIKQLRLDLGGDAGGDSFEIDWIVVGKYGPVTWSNLTNKPADSALARAALGSMHSGGHGDVRFNKNMTYAGVANAGEIQVMGTTFYHPDGVKRTVGSGKEIPTYFEGTATADPFFIIYTDSPPNPRFGASFNSSFLGANYSVHFFTAVYDMTTDTWSAVDNTNLRVPFTPAATDCIVAVGRKFTSASGAGIDTLSSLLGVNTNLPADGATVGADWSTNITGIPYSTIMNNDDSVAMGFNPTFADWPTGSPRPTGWGGSTPTPVRDTTIKRLGQWGVRFDTNGTSQYHLNKKVSFPSMPLGTFLAGTYDVYIDSINAANTTGKPGLMVRMWWGATSPSYTDRHFPAQLVAGSWQRINFTARAPTDKQLVAIEIYMFGSYSSASFGGHFNGNVVFDNFRFALFDSSVDNTAISLGSNGALTGAGGGQVTITGLGYSGDLNATYGAPAGSMVGNTLAQTVEANAANALNGLSDKLSKTAASILTAPITMQSGGSILVGTANDGIVYGATGIAAKVDGIAQFTITADGQATFAGNLSASTGTIGGNTITATEIKSPNFVAGVSGWRIKSDGTAEFDKIELRNLTINPNLVPPLNKWTSNGSGIHRDTTSPLSTDGWFNIHNQGVWSIADSPVIKLEQGINYTISFVGKSNGAGNAVLVACLLDATPNYFFDIEPTAKTFTLSVNSADVDMLSTRLRFIGDNPAYQIAVSDVKLERGQKKTPWCDSSSGNVIFDPFSVNVGDDIYSMGSYAGRTIVSGRAATVTGSSGVTYRWVVENEIVVMGEGVKSIYIDGSTTSSTVTVKALMGKVGEFGTVTAYITCYVTHPTDGRVVSDSFYVECEY